MTFVARKYFLFYVCIYVYMSMDVYIFMLLIIEKESIDKIIEYKAGTKRKK